MNESNGLSLIVKCENVSVLRPLIRVTAFGLKFASQIKAKTRKSDTSVSSEITVTDLAEAETCRIKESECLIVKERNFENWKRQFGLFLDRAGVWRCKGRLANANTPYSTKYPILLDTKHHLTTLIVNDCHQRVMHNGLKEALTEL